MPRPAPKRNRSIKAKVDDATAEPCDQPDVNASKSPERGSTLDPRALRSQTPLAKNYDQALASSPDRPATGSRPGTGSRPPTRSRGYSSTLSFAGRNGDTSSRVPGTPGYESSVLSNFRRRPRQQSILQMMQAEDGSSDLDDDDFLGSLSPQDESTPLNLPRGKPLLMRPAEESLSQSPLESLPSSAGSRKRKRAGVIQVPVSPTAQDMVEDTPSATPVARDQPLDVSEATPRPFRFPGVLSQTMAPPDSSPLDSTAAPRSPAHNNSKSNKSKDPTHLSTAALQDRLLPRRRQRRRKRRPAGEFDVPSDESDEDMHGAASGDDDELSYLPSRRARRGQSGKSKPLGNVREKSKLNNQKQKKSKIKSVPAPRPSEPQAPATYSHVHQSGEIDKENELLLSSPSSSPLSSPPASDASDSEGEAQATRRYVSDELRAAAKKFAEIDKWQMEFEEVSASETQGSPAR
ncbi:hypothetical protein PENDEC_c026G03195 [Penicillium decumbens]|uniref:Uncharacterized protein n=1 Tax=Penicillium decumbens TaxID=69771 RepID=A0A1V6NZG6_PENDC|nr:hypothetical protein PENDEC_c026G03195 [Penicillium decumbens]